MRVSNAAIYFDRELVSDAYTGIPLFRGQVKNFNDASSTGATLRRRVLSLAPSFSVPTRRCVQIGPLKWLAGIGLIDTFQGVEVRNTYNLRVASNLFEVLTPAAACNSAATVNSAYGYEEFFKSSQDSQVSSDYETFWNVFFAPGEPIQEGTFLRVGPRLLRVRQVYVNAEKLKVAQSDELGTDAAQALVFSNLGIYDPITDTYPSTTQVVQGLQMDMLKFYRWRLQAEADKQPGDRSVFAPLTVTPKVGSVFTMAARSWRVVSLQQEQDAWAMHARPI